MARDEILRLCLGRYKSNPPRKFSSRSLKPEVMLDSFLSRLEDAESSRNNVMTCCNELLTNCSLQPLIFNVVTHCDLHLHKPDLSPDQVPSQGIWTAAELCYCLLHRTPVSKSFFMHSAPFLCL